ncbi:MAG: NPXTG-anchored protein [Oscillospiraceae bacterium]|nr:NPXTG-anchored protein [Oscillospiraceae bacterium]
MKKLLSLISVSASAAALLSAVPFSASAADDTVYGTMNIPYTDFYAAELGSSAGEVDAVTSATKAKALKNGEGELFEGTYNNGTDTILGVTYPVAISQADLDALGDDNYGFTALSEAPAAYKEATVSGGKVSFSAVQGSSTQTSYGVKLSTETPWGDYLIDITGTPEDFDTLYRGAILKTADGNAYALRHEQNIWRGELAWSSGIVTVEPHGNTLDSAPYVSLMGSTVTEITLITKTGYVIIPTNTYIPIKFESELKPEDGNAGTDKTTFTESGFPSDYSKTYRIADGFTVADGEISYQDAKPGSYTLTVSDASGKYADVSASFVLSTDDLPVAYADGKLTAAEGFTDDDAAAFIRAIANVNVNGTDYATGRKGTTVVQTADDQFGVIDFDVEARTGKVFADGADGTYTITVTATGYRNPLVFELPVAEEPGTTAPADETGTTETTATTAAANNNGTANAGTVTAPKTGDAGLGAVAAALLLAGAAAFTLRKKH